MKEIIIRGDFEIEGMPKNMAKHLKYCKIKILPSIEMFVDSFTAIEEKGEKTRGKTKRYSINYKKIKENGKR